jgi:hypothetical protein
MRVGEAKHPGPRHVAFEYATHTGLFYEAKAYGGEYDGYVFKQGTYGRGYYRDTKSRREHTERPLDLQLNMLVPATCVSMAGWGVQDEDVQIPAQFDTDAAHLETRKNGHKGGTVKFIYL